MQDRAKKKKSASRDMLPGENLPQFIACLVSAFWANFTARIPVGYQNESGFHYGPEPTPRWLL
jgi:hypothetical protein